jgi:hypothetical protein
MCHPYSRDGVPYASVSMSRGSPAPYAALPMTTPRHAEHTRAHTDTQVMKSSWVVAESRIVRRTWVGNSAKASSLRPSRARMAASSALSSEPLRAFARCASRLATSAIAGECVRALPLPVARASFSSAAIRAARSAFSIWSSATISSMSSRSECAMNLGTDTLQIAQQLPLPSDLHVLRRT